jgi:ribonuclease T2
MKLSFCRLVLGFCGVLMACAALTTAVSAQHKGQPDQFDFYLLNLSWSPEFCSIEGTSPECAAHPGFVVHGLWPQNNDGSYPVFCSERPGPVHPEQNMDITPDRSLLQHEWSKHGTCTKLAPDDFFTLEHKAFHSLVIPRLFNELDHEVLLKPAEIVGSFAKANPSFPAGSILLSCGHNRLTAIEACFSKDGLKPIACQGLRECRAQVVRVTPLAKQ